MSAIRVPVAVAIPARDEAELIGRCLDALANQVHAGEFSIIVVANDCADATAEIAKQPRGIDVSVIETSFALGERSAGHARRAAMAAAAEHGDIVLTTDADCVPDPDWIAAHRVAFGRRVDAVAGRVSGDWLELQRLPPRALQIGGLEWEYLALLAEAEDLIAPRAHDPRPRHAQCCGANLGITSAMLARVGGVPAIPTGEDRALIGAVEAAGGLVRHDPGPHVTASARIDGRASGGMADALAARMSHDYRCDEQFQRADILAAGWIARREGRPPPAAPSARLRPADLPTEIECMRALIAAHG